MLNLMVQVVATLGPVRVSGVLGEVWPMTVWMLEKVPPMAVKKAESSS